MCGRFTSQSSPDRLAEHFGAELAAEEDLGARYNVAPTDDVYVVAEHGGVRRLGTQRWGLVPFWADDPSVGARMINARSDTVASKPAYRRAFAKRRCIVPADGFYEWKAVPGARRKQPYLVRRRDGAPLALAGLWEVWRDRGAGDDGERLTSCVIVTTDANELLRPVHDRMPVVLEPDVWDVWLDPDNDDLEELQALLVPAPEDLLELVPVSTRVNDVRNDGPDLVEPVEVGEEAAGAGDTPRLL
jgi:putative SOS response-associated peptidase YedK